MENAYLTFEPSEGTPKVFTLQTLPAEPASRAALDLDAEHALQALRRGRTRACYASDGRCCA